jgi:hypothetical protein
MGTLETIYRLMRKAGLRPALDVLPFEELTGHYGWEGEAVFAEFVRRLDRIVFYAALDYCVRQNPSASKDEIEEQKIRVFEDFAPEFGSGDPPTLLRRFAEVIRRGLDEKAFEKIAHRYYYQLPLYHLKDDRQRQFLAAFYQNGVGTEEGKRLAEDLAERFQVTVEEAGRLLEKGQRSVNEIIENDFTTQELSELTEGNVP